MTVVDWNVKCTTLALCFTVCLTFFFLPMWKLSKLLDGIFFSAYAPSHLCHLLSNTNWSGSKDAFTYAAFSPFESNPGAVSHSLQVFGQLWTRQSQSVVNQNNHLSDVVSVLFDYSEKVIWSWIDGTKRVFWVNGQHSAAKLTWEAQAEPKDRVVALQDCDVFWISAQ